MKIISATLFALKIPFIEAFSHSIRDRTYSDSIVVRLKADNGTVGYGEAVARPYVTGETVESALAFMENILWPAVQQTEYEIPSKDLDPEAALAWIKNIAETLPCTSPSTTEQVNKNDTVIAWNAARAGWELALIDCLLKSEGLSLCQLLPPKRSTVIYSGVITSSSIEQAVKTAKRFQQVGLPHLKVKVTGTNDQERLSAIRAAVGPEPSIRIDGNGAYTVEEAIATCKILTEFSINSAEQMIPRGKSTDLATVQAASPIPQMADESLITLADAHDLIESQACTWFNLRISKCGGLAQTIAIAQLADKANIQYQLGCQVGETAILSAAGRHLAAWLPLVTFVEGSYGKLLLSRDVSRKPINFGHKGKAPLLTKPGLGIEVQNTVLATYAHQTITLEA